MSGAVDIRLVRGGADFDAFVKAPRRLYRGQPGWIAPLDVDRRRAFDPRRNPFFEHAQSARWLALRGGEVVGRISAQIDRLHIERYRDATGHFGCLDAIDDVEVVKSLIDAAEAWLGDRGMKRVTGPFNPSINAETGMLIDGFGFRPMFLVPWNPPYLPGHVEAAGYSKAIDLFDYDIDLARPPSSIGARLLERSEFAGRVVVREANVWKLRAEVRLALRLFNDAWSQNWGFVPFTDAEMDAAAAAMRPILRNDSAIFVEVDGTAVAFIMAVPNLLEWIATFDGRLLPFGWAKIAWHLMFPRLRTMRVPLMGVASKYQKTAFGAILALLAIEALHKRAHRVGAERAELGWILEDNLATSRLIERIGATRAKTYRVYQRAIPARSTAVAVRQ